ncbi:MAG: Ig-like domain-containing protein [Bacteroides sp.]|nr:Ig-like domain-containing protein [Eubacterium sp.]MCM1418180.1 Ig-like domain-containing protein [Roseburia sp.]MCM1462295.1 Ig-like domain-containing protein [Bacteroides sp.]
MKENIAQTSGKLFLPKSANAIFKVDDMVAFIARANTSANVDIQTTQDTLTGGQNNAVIGIITSEKAIDVSFDTPEWQPEFLAANIGTAIRYGSQNFTIDDLTFNVENGKILLSERPADDQIQISVGSAWVTIEVPADSLSIDVSEYGFQDGECVSVIGLFKRVGKEISLAIDTDPTVGTLILSSPIFKGTKGKVGTAQYTFPAFVLSGNWTQAFQADASYTISGKPVAVAGEKCGEGETYGYYREYIDDEDTVDIAVIAASPSVVELTVGDTQQLSVYGARNAMYEKILLESDVVYAAEGDAVTVSETGLITAVKEGEATVKIAYNNLTATATVIVTTATD